MSKRVIVLGAGGRFGRAACRAFKDRNWKVTAVTRRDEPDPTLVADHHIACDVMNSEALTVACNGHDVIVNAVNPPYEDWQAFLPTITKNVIAVARSTGSTVCIPGNVYVYGNPIPKLLKEDTPHAGNTKKGRLRIEMERAYRDAVSDGVQTIILRGGDFIDGMDTGNWFESYITKPIQKRKITYPGPPDIPHAWAYLPDMARALVELAELRHKFQAFEEFGFEGFTLTGSDIARIAAKATGRPVRIATFPWLVVRFMAVFSRGIREVLEMRYLWEQPHKIDGQKLKLVLSDFRPTPEETAIGNALAQISSALTPPAASRESGSDASGPAQQGLAR